MPSLVDGPAGDAYVSTGELPDRELVERLVHEAHDRYRANRDGVISQAYPALASVPVDLFGVCVVGTSGATFAAGHADYEFTNMSVSKPFVFALVCEQFGSDLARERLGVNSTGLPFNSFYAVERSTDGRTNPMVNAGAIATTSTSLAAGDRIEERWRFIHEGLSRFAGRELSLDPPMFTPLRRRQRTRATRASPGCWKASTACIARVPMPWSCTRGSAACASQPEISP